MNYLSHLYEGKNVDQHKKSRRHTRDKNKPEKIPRINIQFTLSTDLQKIIKKEVTSFSPNYFNKCVAVEFFREENRFLETDINPLVK